MTDAALPITGGCVCGAVRYAIAAEPLGARTCWCRYCQHIAAGSASVNAIFPARAVTIGGPIRHFERIADSGNHMKSGFCPDCGTQLTSASTERAHLLIVRVGTLDEPDRIAPQATIWADAAPHWAPIDPDLPRHGRQPPPVA
ncbi:MAG TPA: GFA family protein [Sphingomonas sp.]